MTASDHLRHDIATIVGAIQAVRKARKITLAELSDRTNLAVPNISAILGHKRNCSLDTLEALAQAVGLKIRVEVTVLSLEAWQG